MNRRRFSALTATLLLTLAWAVPARAAAGPEIGKPAPAFDLQGTDGQQHKLADFKGKIVVLLWQGNQCPWDKAYRPVFSSTYNQYHMTTGATPAEQVVFLGINSNKGESLDQIKAVETDSKLPYAILKDASNKVADLYGARATPHVFVIDRDGVLRYKGGVEKAPLSPDDVGKSSEQYLAPVLAALVAGKEPPVTDKSTEVRGCSIKRERQ